MGHGDGALAAAHPWPFHHHISSPYSPGIAPRISSFMVLLRSVGYLKCIAHKGCHYISALKNWLLRAWCCEHPLLRNSMNIEKKHAARDELRQHSAAEVIELGEMLFDMAIGPAAQRPARDKEVDAVLIEEMRVATDEFFTALRLVLGG